MRTLTGRRVSAEHPGRSAPVKIDLPKYVTYGRSKNGKAYLYYRRGGKLIPLPIDPLSGEFRTEYDRVHGSFSGDIGANHQAGSLSAVWTEYQDTAEFKELAEATKADYRRNMGAILPDYGDLMVSTATRAGIKAIRKNFADTPRKANYIVQVLSVVFTFAIEAEYRTTNPCARIKPLRGGQGHRPWEESEIALFRSHWPADTRERVAFELLLNTGQRGGDVRVMAPQQAKGEQVAVRQSKTAERLWIPQARELRAILSAWLKANPASLVIIPSQMTGAALTDKAFGKMMRRAFRAAGLSCTTHGLRYTAATRLRELGLDWDAIAAIVGHRTVTMVQKYTRQRRNAALAIAAIDGIGR